MAHCRSLLRILGSSGRKFVSAAVPHVPGAASTRRFSVQTVRHARIQSMAQVSFLDEQEDALQALRRIVRSHTPKTLTEDIKADIVERVHEIFGRHTREIASVTFHCCPLLAATTAHMPMERRASGNRLVVVYVATNEEVASYIANRSLRHPPHYVMEEWLVLRDLPVFALGVARGMSLMVDAALPFKECLLHRSESLQKALDAVSNRRDFYCRPFLYKASLEAVNAFYPNNWQLKETRVKSVCDFDMLCRGLWIRHIITRHERDAEPYTNWPDVLAEDILSDEEKSLLNSATYPDSRPDVAEKLYHWYFPFYAKLNNELFGSALPDALDKGLSDLAMSYHQSQFKFADPPKEGEGQLKLAKSLLSPFQKSTEEFADHLRNTRVMQLVKEGTSPFSRIQPEDLLFFSMSGSHLYNLSLPTSDEDIGCVFRWNDPEMLARQYSCQVMDVYELRAFAEQVGNKDLASLVGFEARKFVFMLTNGAIEWAQVMFADDPSYETSHFAKLKANRHLLLSDDLVNGYFGYIRHALVNCTTKDMVDQEVTPVKALYQCYHKLIQVEQLVRGDMPTPTVTGETRDFIMKIRTSDRSLEFDTLVADADQRLKAAAHHHLHNKKFPRHSDKKFFVEWLSELYGLDYARSTTIR